MTLTLANIDDFGLRTYATAVGGFQTCVPI